MKKSICLCVFLVMTNNAFATEVFQCSGSTPEQLLPLVDVNLSKVQKSQNGDSINTGSALYATQSCTIELFVNHNQLVQDKMSNIYSLNVQVSCDSGSDYPEKLAINDYKLESEFNFPFNILTAEAKFGEQKFEITCTQK